MDRDTRVETVSQIIGAYLDALLDLEDIDTDDLAETIVSRMERVGETL